MVCTPSLQPVSLAPSLLHCTFPFLLVTPEAPNPATMDTIYSFDYYTESWIEIASQPSSSSLSSTAADENGLRLQHDYHVRRRRRLNPNAPLPYNLQARPRSAAGSSQEEYEESESESDRIMSSSNEGLEPQSSDGLSPPVPISSASEPISSEDNDDDDDENSTALGVLTAEPVFTPQPNAFSHPRKVPLQLMFSHWRPGRLTFSLRERHPTDRKRIPTLSIATDPIRHTM